MGPDGGYQVDKTGKVIQARIMVDIDDSKWKDINGGRYEFRFSSTFYIFLLICDFVSVLTFVGLSFVETICQNFTFTFSEISQSLSSSWLAISVNQEMSTLQRQYKVSVKSLLDLAQICHKTFFLLFPFKKFKLFFLLQISLS